MYRIVVVDDELWFREGIRGTIKWSEYDAEIVGEAHDGEEALEVIERENPDIIFADVRMPVMDGLELASVVAEKYPHIKMIIVSGYEEFEYARKAMSLGVSYYLTKPVDADQLVSIVKKVKQEIDSVREENSRRKKIERQLRESLPLLKEKFLNSLMDGEIRNIEEIQSKLEFLNIPLQLKKYLVFMVDIEYSQKIYSGQQEKDKQLTQFAVTNILEEIFQEEKGILVFNGHSDYIIGLATFDNPISAALVHINMSKLLNKSRSLIQKFLKLTVTIGVSRVNDRWDRVEDAYKEAVDAVKCKLFLGKGQVIFFQDIAINKNQDNYYAFQGKEELIDAVKLENPDRAKSILNNNFHALMEKKYLDYDYIQQIYFGLLGDILNYMHGNGIDPGVVFRKNPFKVLLGLSTLEDINLWFTDITGRLIEHVAGLRLQQGKNVIEKVMEYVNENFNKDISLNSAAEFVFLSPAYLSRLFRKETGRSFIESIMEARVRKAKELLRHTDKKAYEIAREVGYNDIGYFTKMFKAMEGMTPAQYREKF